MEESTQQLISLTIVISIVALDLIRRWRKALKSQAGCSGCGPKQPETEKIISFYKRQG